METIVHTKKYDAKRSNVIPELFSFKTNGEKLAKILGIHAIDNKLISLF